MILVDRALPALTPMLQSRSHLEKNKALSPIKDKQGVRDVGKRKPLPLGRNFYPLITLAKSSQHTVLSRFQCGFKKRLCEVGPVL